MHQIERYKLTGSDILVIRLLKAKEGEERYRENQYLTSAKPCINCMRAMSKAGIRKVYYSDYGGVINQINVSSLSMKNYKRETK